MTVASPMHISRAPFRIWYFFHGAAGFKLGICFNTSHVSTWTCTGVKCFFLGGGYCLASVVCVMALRTRLAFGIRLSLNLVHCSGFGH